jgi:hypothetical protein
MDAPGLVCCHSGAKPDGVCATNCACRTHHKRRRDTRPTHHVHDHPCLVATIPPTQGKLTRVGRRGGQR